MEYRPRQIPPKQIWLSEESLNEAFITAKSKAVGTARLMPHKREEEFLQYLHEALIFLAHAPDGPYAQLLLSEGKE